MVISTVPVIRGRLPVLSTVFHCNGFIREAVKQGCHVKALTLFRQMLQTGLEPNNLTFPFVAKACGKLMNCDYSRIIHGYVVKSPFKWDKYVQTALLDMYAKCDRLDDAHKVFDKMPETDLASWNALLVSFSNAGLTDRVARLFEGMRFNGIRSDAVTIMGLTQSSSLVRDLRVLNAVHGFGIQIGVDRDVSVANTWISAYFKGAYAEIDDLDEALFLFHSMEEAGQKPDAVTMLHLISGCSRIGSLETGRWLDRYIGSNGLKTNVMVCNQLLDMYSKCGSIDDAHHLFDEMPEQTVVSWTTIIVGFALNGRFERALEFFFRMCKFGIKPNHITFLAVLQACSHGGFLDEGWECYHLMTKVYCLSPELDHYSCMVDLLGRKGKIKEAFLFIQNMPVKPDGGIWGALLRACKNYGNLEIGEYAAYRLFELDPCVAAPYVELANMYASVGRWDGVAIIRRLMKENKVTKVPGQSIIQVNGKSHVFTVDDSCHPLGVIIHDLLDSLALQLKEEKELSL